MHAVPRSRIHFRLVSLALFAISAVLPAAAQQITVWKTGNTVNATISATLSGTRCCLGLSFDSPLGGAECTEPCPKSPETESWYCNSVGDHTVTGCWLGAETGYAYQCSTQTVTVDPVDQAQPSPSCPLFDLVAGSKVLTHLYDPNDVYPYPQTQDAQMPITIKARRAAAGSLVYLKVLDPPDPSTYGGPYLGDDNHDTTAPVGTINGQKQLQVLLPPSGESATLTLVTTSYAAGDNYEVRGSTDPNYLSDPSFQCTDCPDSGVITAWKRVYLETDKMFRTGAQLTADAAAGTTTLSVSSVAGFVAPKGKTPGSNVVLVHAPATSGTTAIYYEPAAGDAPLTVAKVNSRKREITLSRPLTHSYFTAPPPNPQPWLSDGVGVVTGSATDFYTPNTSFLAGLFMPAFVEVVTIPSSDPGYVGYYANFTDPFRNDLTQAGERWFRHFRKPNYICSIGGANSGADLGDRVTGDRISWTWVAKVESLVSSTNRATLNGEATSHEMTHTWDVNPHFNNGGHCAGYDYLMPTLLCLMRPGDDWFDSTGTTIRPEYYDGRVMWHYDLQALNTSEYLTIRLHPEPLQ